MWALGRFVSRRPMTRLGLAASPSLRVTTTVFKSPRARQPPPLVKCFRTSTLVSTRSPLRVRSRWLASPGWSASHAAAADRSFSRRTHGHFIIKLSAGATKSRLLFIFNVLSVADSTDPPWVLVVSCHRRGVPPARTKTITGAQPSHGRAPDRIDHESCFSAPQFRFRACRAFCASALCLKREPVFTDPARSLRGRSSPSRAPCR